MSFSLFSWSKVKEKKEELFTQVRSQAGDAVNVVSVVTRLIT